MQNFITLLERLFHDACLQAFPQLKDQEFPIEIAQSTQEKFGHYQFNSAMKLAKPLRLAPRVVAEELVKNLNKEHIIEKVEIAGPGFINMWMEPNYLSKCAQEMILDDEHLGIEKPQIKKRIVVEFSSPNVAKELHVGHLRSTIIGESIARLLEFLGHDVIRLNHIGDWGTQFGMLIAYLKQETPDVLTGEKETDLTQLVTWYKASKAKFDADPVFKKSAQMEVVALQGGEAASLKAWNIMRDISRKAYEEIYDLLDVTIQERGESFYNPYLAEIVSDLEKKGLVEVSDGAKCVFFQEFANREGQPMPLMVQKSDGGYTYDTTDVAAMRYRAQNDKADRIIVITDAGQILHFQLVYAASVKAGYIDPQKTRFDHVPFGLVLGADGKKFKTRSGDTERLIDLLNTAVERAGEIVKERSPDIREDEKLHLAKAIGIGAVKYADLSSHRVSDYSFSYDRMLRFEGNTAVFLMYAYVRIEGIKRKIGISIDELRNKSQIKLEHPSELALGLHLTQFDETLETVAEDLLPNRLSEYLYTLAQKFNAFYRDCQVEGSPEQNSRLLLCELTARVLKQGLQLLGVETVGRM